MPSEKEIHKLPANMREIIGNTIFLVKTLDDVENFLTPGKDYKVLAHTASEIVLKRYPNVYIGCLYHRTRFPNNQFFFDRGAFEENELLDKIGNIWIAQATQWSDDLKLIGKRVFSIEFQLFERLNNKFVQGKLISDYLEKTNCFNFIKEKQTLLNTEIALKNPVLFSYFSKKHQIPFVLSGPLSDGGSGIYLIKSNSDFTEAIFQIESPVIRVEKFVDSAIPLSQMAIVFGNKRVIKYQPSIQIVTDLFHQSHFTYVGNDFCLDVHLNQKNYIVDKVNELTNRVGEFLHSLGYRGAFGCDFLIKGSDVYFLELNPRYISSIILLTLNTPLLLHPHLLHIFSFVEDTSPNFIEGDYLALGNQGCYKSFVRIKNDNGGEDLRKPPGSAMMDKNYFGYKIFKGPIISRPYFPTGLVPNVKII